MLTFDQLETLRTIVRCGTFSKAAEEMFLTQPAVSQRVKHLEQALGIEVFVRGTSQRGFNLTEAGERILRFANEVLGSLDSLQREVHEKVSLERHTVTIASGPFIGKYILPKLINLSRERFPELHVRNKQYLASDEISDAVKRGDADFSIQSETFAMPGLTATPLFRDRVVLVAHPTHRLFQHESFQPREIGNHAFVLTPSNSEARMIAERWAEGMGFRLDIVIETGSYEAAKEAAIQGLGLAVVPDTMVHEDVEHGRLRVVHLAGLPCDRVISLIHNPERPLSQASTGLLSIVREGMWRQQMLVHNPC